MAQAVSATLKAWPSATRRKQMADKVGHHAAAVEKLRIRLARWRSGSEKSRNMPETLWRAAARLAESDGISATARAFGLNYAGLKRHVQSGRRRAANRKAGATPLLSRWDRQPLRDHPQAYPQVSHGVWWRSQHTTAVTWRFALRVNGRRNSHRCARRCGRPVDDPAHAADADSPGGGAG